MSRVTLGLIVLRAVGLAALVLLLVNPAWVRSAPPDATPLVLLDASLSLTGRGGRWAEALDSARAAASGGVIWRFGEQVSAFDTLPPGAGASRLGPALAGAAARRGPVVVVTDGEVADAAGLPADLRSRPRVVVLPRAPFSDLFVAAVDGMRRVAAGDTVRLTATVGVAGPAARHAGARLVVAVGERQLAVRPLTLPDSGTVGVEIAFAAARLPQGPSALTIAVEGAGDDEPRNDARRFVVELTPRPGVVVLADPPDWEVRFLARALGDVARTPVRTFVRPAAAAGWRDGATLAPVTPAEVVRAVAAARLVVHRAGAVPAGVAAGTARLAVAATPDEGDWYVTAPPASRLAAALAGIAWDSLPPLTAVTDDAPDSGAVTVLAAALTRRGRPVPVVLLRDDGSARVAELRGSGFWRWSFRGGASDVAYRALVAGLGDWLLGAPGARRERAVPLRPEAARGLPLEWRRAAGDTTTDIPLRLEDADTTLADTLRFDASGRATLRLPPGEWRYVLAGGPERGVVVVEEWSDEWRVAPVTLASQAGTQDQAIEWRGLRDRWWLFVVAIAAFAAEWAWRRREGLA